MPKFLALKRLPLDFVAEAWKDCYLEFRSPSLADVQRMANMKKPDAEKKEDVDASFTESIQFLQGVFHTGKAISETGMVDVKGDDLADLPAEVVFKAMHFLVQSTADLTSDVSPKSSTPAV